MTPPTDLQILEKIYNCYYSDFVNFNPEKRITKLYVPIDIDFIGKSLNVDGDIVFGRLNYHLNKKYSFTQENKTKVIFFLNSHRDGGRAEKHLIRFELMASVLAEMLLERRRFRMGNAIAVASLIISLGALLISFLSNRS